MPCIIPFLVSARHARQPNGRLADHRPNDEGGAPASRNAASAVGHAVVRP